MHLLSWIHRKSWWLLLLIVATSGLPVHGQPYAKTGLSDFPIASATTDHTKIEVFAPEIELATNEQEQRPLVVRLTPEPGWHTYWKNPGDAGLPPSFTLTIDGKRVQPDTVYYPAPSRVPEPPLLTYGYKIATDFLAVYPLKKNSGKTIEFNANWLICKDICIPDKATLALPLAALADGKTPLRELIAAYQLPSLSNATITPAAAGEVTLSIPLPATAMPEGIANDVYFYGPKNGALKHQMNQPFTIAEGVVNITLPLANGTKKLAPADFSSGVLSITAPNGQQQHFTVDNITIIAQPPQEAPPLPPQPIAESIAKNNAGPAISFWLALAYAFLGGLILNLMPCVFPVLALKGASLLHHGRDLAGSLWYTAGILASFLGFTALLLSFRASIGWGFQLQEPVFVAALCLLFVAMALNLLGAFELPSFTFRQTTTTHRPIQQFSTGVLAVLVATPCTAPFMGVALGYSLTQPPGTVLAIFMALGLGLALPYVLLSNLNIPLPKPGPWLVRFKQFLAYPLLLTTLWLAWVLVGQVGGEGLLCVLAAVILGSVALWFKPWPRVPQLIGVAVIIVGIVWLLQQLAAIATVATPPPNTQQFTEATLTKALANGNPVFVNMTARWCITCKLNEYSVLKTAAVEKLLADNDVQVLVGDWTNYNPEITSYLRRHGREGVPLYVLYQPTDRASHKTHILPNILSRSVMTQYLEKL